MYCVADEMARVRSPSWVGAHWNDGFWMTAPVGSFLPNAFGLHDMCGNVFEWTVDCVNPHELEDRPVNPQAGGSRVIRGGSDHEGPEDSRSAARDMWDPLEGSSLVGVRLARPLQ
jgi:formylglycine-generating enzyme required for sulfatase activity